ncbi:hypothetical protein PMAYCL1PPCAC_33322, partial [Pristionchus mayeri]
MRIERTVRTEDASTMSGLMIMTLVSLLNVTCLENRWDTRQRMSRKESGSWTRTRVPRIPSAEETEETSLKFSAKDIGDSVINIRIEDKKNKFDVSTLLDLPRATQPSYSPNQLRVVVNDAADPFSFRVERKNGNIIFDTSPGGLVFADKFIQLAVKLPSTNMFGWGENVHPNLKACCLSSLSLHGSLNRSFRK